MTDETQAFCFMCYYGLYKALIESGNPGKCQKKRELRAGQRMQGAGNKSCVFVVDSAKKFGLQTIENT